ncbi:MAG: hypothetical protein R6W83_02855 [Cryobacterium sp.]
MGNSDTPRLRRPIVAGLLGLAAVAAYAIVGVLQILVFNPLAAVPGATLAEIRAQMAQADQPLTANAVVTWAITGVLLAVLVLVIAATRHTLSTELVVAATLVLLVFAAPGHIFVAFLPGMSLADTFMISGGDHAPWGAVLYLVSGLALAALIVLIIRAARAPAGGPVTLPTR